MFTVWRVPVQMAMESKSYQKMMNDILSLKTGFVNYFKEDQPGKVTEVEGRWAPLTAKVKDWLVVCEDGMCPSIIAEKLDGERSDSPLRKKIFSTLRIKSFQTKEQAEEFARQAA